MSENSGRLQINSFYTTLSDYRCRQIVGYMDNSAKNAFHRDDIARILANQENEPFEISDTTREQVKIDLHHRHLPKLDDAGLIEYDSRNGDVRYQGTIDGDIVDISKSLNCTEETSNAIDQ